MGSDESHFNVALIVRDKVARQCPCTDHNPFEEMREPKRYRAEAHLLASLTPYRWANPAPLAGIYNTDDHYLPAAFIVAIAAICPL